jgi:type IV pilus assembly protein PilP
MKHIGKHLGRVVGMMLLLVMLSACSESMDDLEKYIVSVRTKPATPIEPIPPVKTYAAYDYDGQTSRDPFGKSLNEEAEKERPTKSTGPHPDFERSKEYLERYELDTLSMVGTFRRGDSYWALVRDPEGVIHRVPVGNFIGRNHGQVVHINDSQMDLSELVSDGTGGWIVRDASVALGEG